MNSVPHAPRSRRKDSGLSRTDSGFTMVELLLTALVIGTAFVAATWSMSATARTKAAYEKEGGPSVFLGQEIQTLADSLPREPSGMTGAVTGAGVVALDSLIGASFSPPILADGSAAEGYDDWQQNVDLSVYSLSDLTMPTDDDPADGLAPESDKIYRLDVEVLQGGETVKTYSWWIHP
jgi:prepilin-type N-terminal cleavage/methylation domain-containing protein